MRIKILMASDKNRIWAKTDKTNLEIANLHVDRTKYSTYAENDR